MVDDVMGTRRRRAGLATAVGVLVVVLAALAAGPARAQGTRYVDPVFTQVDVTAGIEYRQAVGCTGNPVALALDRYEPAGDTEAARPVLIWIHGGSFAIGSRDGALEQIVGNDWAQRGYVVVSISYRLCPTLSFDAIDDAYEDARAAVAFVRANAAAWRIDPEKVVVGGASAGAITALQVGYTPDRGAGEGTHADPSHADAVLSYAGAWLPGGPEAGEPPLFMAHGVDDDILPFSGAQGFCDAVLAVGGTCELHAYDAGHESLVVHLADIEAKSFAFLVDALGLVEQPPATTTTGAPPSTTSSTVSPASSSTVAPAGAPGAPAPPRPAAVSPRFTG